MDEDVKAAVARHREQFGEFNATILGLDMGDADTKRKLLVAIDEAIESGTPISDAAIGVTIEADVLT